MSKPRALMVVLGDQLDLDATAFDGFDATVDAVWMAEVNEESTHVWSSKPSTRVRAMRWAAFKACAAWQSRTRRSGSGAWPPARN